MDGFLVKLRFLQRQVTVYLLQAPPLPALPSGGSCAPAVAGAAIAASAVVAVAVAAAAVDAAGDVNRRDDRRSVAPCPCELVRLTLDDGVHRRKEAGVGPLQ